MTTYSKLKLSGSTDGKPLKLTQTSTPGTTIHTAISGTTDGVYDEIWLYGYNGHSANVVCTVEYGGVDVPDQNIVVTLPYKAGLIPIIPGLILQNSLVVRAYAATANVITIVGFVNRIN